MPQVAAIGIVVVVVIVGLVILLLIRAREENLQLKRQIEMMLPWVKQAIESMECEQGFEEVGSLAHQNWQQQIDAAKGVLNDPIDYPCRATLTEERYFKVYQLGIFTPDSEALLPVVIGQDGLCTCDCASKCPLGKVGSAPKCTQMELTLQGFPTCNEWWKRADLRYRSSDHRGEDDFEV